MRVRVTASFDSCAVGLLRDKSNLWNILACWLGLLLELSLSRTVSAQKYLGMIGLPN